MRLPGGARLGGLVHHLGHFVGRSGQSLHRLADLRSIAALDGLFGFLNRPFNVLGVVFGDLITVLLQQLFRGVDHRVGTVLHLGVFLIPFVLFGVRLGLLGHSFNFVLRKAARSGDGDLLLAAGGVVLGRNVQDAVGVNVEGHLDLRHTAHGGGNSHQVELPQRPIVGGAGPLSLQDMHFDGGLVVRGGGKGLALAGRDRRITGNQRGKDPAQRLNPQRQRCDVEQQQVFHFPAQHAGL